MVDATAPKVPVWLDCDPGHDDTFAILMAAYHPGIQLLGISTVFGNAPLEKTTNNAASILTSIAKHDEIPVYAGASHALERPPMHHPTDIHGESGLDGTELLPQPLKAPNTTDDAVEAMAAALRAQPAGTAYLVATGSFTNAAALFARHPDLVAHVRGLTLMGGAFGSGFTDCPMGRVGNVERVGNYTPWAEFNIIADPEAAAAIFSDRALAAKTVLAPLDLTHQVLATAEVRDLLLFGPEGALVRDALGGRGKTTLRQMLVELLMFFAKTYADVFGITAGPPLHDPLAVAMVLVGTPWEIAFHDYEGSDLEKTPERFDVKVVTEGSYEDAVAGKTETGRTTLTKLPPGQEGVTIPRGMDAGAFWKVLEECISRADEANAKLGTANGAAK